jgi:hypothetical protein
MAILLNDAVFKSHTFTSGTNAPRDQAQKSSAVQAFKRSAVAEWFRELPLAHSCGFLPFLNPCNFLGSCTNVFSGIGVELGNCSLFRCLLDIVDVIADDLLRLRVVDHH